MVAQPKEQPSSKSIVMEWITAEVETTGNLIVACNAAAERAEREGLLPQLWKELGGAMLDDMWRRVISAQRSDALRAMNPGARRINIMALNERASILEQLVRLPHGAWVTIGDLTKANCVTMSQDYHKRTIELDRRSAFFGALGKKLKATKTVREAFTEEEVQAILDRIE